MKAEDLKAGDVVILKGGIGFQTVKVKLTGSPEWSEFHKRWYVGAYRWILTKEAWSKSARIFNFTAFDPVF